MTFVDLHSHVLPGIDDGSGSISESIEMAKLAVAEGITRILCTPHIQPGRFDNTIDTIQSAFAELKQALTENAISLEIAFAAECHFGLEIVTGVEQGNLPYMGEWQGTRVLLLEFPHGHVPYGAEELTAWLLEHNITPMIAHPERNRGFISSPSRLSPFLKQGCLLQLTTASFLGRFGNSAKSLAESLAKEDKITVVGSDCHNVESRPPLFHKPSEYLRKLVDGDKVNRWFIDNPAIITEPVFASAKGWIT